MKKYMFYIYILVGIFSSTMKRKIVIVRKKIV